MKKAKTESMCVPGVVGNREDSIWRTDSRS